MKIGIDATVVAQYRIVGISRFVINLVEQLAARGDEHEYYLFYRPRALKRPSLLWCPADDRFHRRILQEPLNRRQLRRLDVFHATYQRLPRYHDVVPFLGSLHDIFYLSRADSGSERTRQRWQARYRDVAARSRLIMTLSEFSRTEIIRLLGVPPDHVRVVPLAPSSAYRPQERAAVERLRSRHHLERPYVLFAGGFGRRKNVLGALRAFARAAEDVPDIDLVLSGTGGPLEPQARSFVSQRGLGSRVRFLGFVPDEDYPTLIAGSLLFFFPSLLEGFGLPALEAMACGAPLLTSSTTSLPEVCGDAAALVDPADDDAMAAALTALARDPSQRDSLRRRGFERARAFSWRRTAEIVLGLYEEITAS